MKKDFQVVSHTADIKILVYGKTLSDLFRNALVGMFQSVGPRSPECKVVEERLVCPNLPISRDLFVSAINKECLLVDFLSDALYLSDVHDEAYLDAEIHELDDTTLKATLKGIKVERFEVVEIKAVTYHDLAIRKIDDRWQTAIVFDI